MPSQVPAENHCVTGVSCAQKHCPAVYAPMWSRHFPLALRKKVAQALAVISNTAKDLQAAAISTRHT